MRTKDLFNTLKKGKLAYIFILPALIHYTIFTIYPIINGLRIAFYKWDGMSPQMEFVGLGNLFKVVKDPYVWNALGHNILISLAMVFGLIFLGLGLALALEKIKRKLQTSVITILFIPHILSLVVVAIIFRLLFDPTFGKINSFLREIGLGNFALNWLGDMKPILRVGSIALFSIIVVMLWKSYGMRMVLYHAAIKGLPQEIYDAAKIDGASGWQLFWRLTWPLLWPITSMLTILTVIGSLQVFELIYIMTGGGPAHKTETMGVYIFNQAFSVGTGFGNYGYSIAISFVLFILVASLTLVNLKLMKKRR